MDLSFLPETTPVWLLAGSFLVSFISSIVPVVSIELFLAAVAALLPLEWLPLSILLGGLGQTAGKVVIYAAGSGVIRLPFRKYENKMDAIRERFEKWKGGERSFIFVSAAFGLPPFYLVSVSAGLLRLKVRDFYLFGFIGSLARYILVVSFPVTVMRLLGIAP